MSLLSRRYPFFKFNLFIVIINILIVNWSQQAMVRGAVVKFSVNDIASFWGLRGLQRLFQQYCWSRIFYSTEWSWARIRRMYRGHWTAKVRCSILGEQCIWRSPTTSTRDTMSPSLALHEPSGRRRPWRHKRILLHA